MSDCALNSNELIFEVAYEKIQKKKLPSTGSFFCEYHMIDRAPMLCLQISSPHHRRTFRY
jgi:hypothetical protein